MAEQLGAGDPRAIGPYALLERLGSGGMGAVYLAKTRGGRLLAIKVIHAFIASDPEFRQRFRREVAAARTVSGLYTALVVDADPDAPTPWFATAFIKGPTLAQAVETAGPLGLKELLALAGGLTEALQAIHDAGLVHRDLKPSNVLLAEDGPRVIDFGISRAQSNTALTSSGTVMGTPAYMSPEQAIGGPMGPASDVFSLGAVLVFAATGGGPYGNGPDHTMVYRILHEAPDLASVPEPMRPLIAACMIRDPEQRPTPSQILQLLQDLGAGAGTAGTHYSPDAGPLRDETFIRWREATGIAPAGAASGSPRQQPTGDFEVGNPTAAVPAAPMPPAGIPTTGIPAAGIPKKGRRRRRLNLADGLAALFNRPVGPAIADGAGPSPPQPVPAGWPAVPGPPAPGRMGDTVLVGAIAAPGPEAPVRIVDPDSITSRDEFSMALRKVREHAAMSPRDLAAASGLPASTVRGYFERGRLPAERDVLRQVLRACGIPDRELQGWDGALVRVRSQRQRVTGARRPQAPGPGQRNHRLFVFGPSDDPGRGAADGRPAGEPGEPGRPGDEADLLFRVYIPKSELYAEQRREMLRHFRVWLTTVQGQDIREEDFTARDGATVAFFVGAGQPRPPLHDDYREFLSFVEYCVHNPAVALTHLTQIGIPQRTGTIVVADCAKKFHRMEMDLRHSRVNMINGLQQALESELLEGGGDPRGIATLQIKIRSLIEQVVPPPTAGTAMPAISEGQQVRQDTQATRDAYAAGHDLHIHVHDPAHPPFDPEQFIRAALERIQGTATFSPEAKKLLALIGVHGNEEAELLRAALHELEDPGIPVTTKSEARRTLTRFLDDLVGRLPDDAGLDQLHRYVAGGPGGHGA